MPCGVDLWPCGVDFGPRGVDVAFKLCALEITYAKHGFQINCRCHLALNLVRRCPLVAVGSHAAKEEDSEEAMREKAMYEAEEKDNRGPDA